MDFETKSLIALYQQNRFNEALSLASRIVLNQPENDQAYNIMGLVSLGLSDTEQALSCFNNAIKLNSRSLDYQLNLSLAYSSSDRLDKAVKVLNKIIKKNKKYYLAHNALGSVYFKEKKYEYAIDNFKKAIAIRDDYTEAIYNLANVLSLKGDFSSAINCYKKLYSKNTNDLEVKKTLVQLYLKLNNTEQALEISAGDAECVYLIAAYEEMQSSLDKANLYIDSCIEFNRDNLKYINLKATILRRMGDASEAIKVIENANYSIDVNTDIETKVCVEFELGKSHDKNKSYDEAFKHYQLANNLNNQINSIDSPKVTSFIKHLDIVNETLTEDWIGEWCIDYDYISPRPVLFMVAFPRSGTTLLDQVVDGHSEFAVMEELPIIGDVIKEAIKITGGQYPALLPKLNKNLLNRLRKYYFKRVDEQFSYDKRKMLVDKLPLNVIELEIIHLLFPQSKVILSMRHPYDVCLSNYMQHYSANEAMTNFNTLESTAATYHKVMRLWAKYIALFPCMQTHVVCYEKLVDDIETEVKALVDFLGVEWQSKMLDFHLHALTRRSLNTPSYQQVTQPVYTSSRYRWKNYENHIVNHFKCLNVYVEAFGYEV